MPLLLPLTGIDQIDQQHLKLVKLIDQLFNMVDKEDFDKEMLEILAQLFQFTAEHFSTEEGYLKIVDYPELEQHVVEHRFFENELKGWVQKFLMGQLEAKQLHQELMEWFTVHVLDNDMKFVPYLKKDRSVSKGMI